jgi:hypothetical protein
VRAVGLDDGEDVAALANRPDDALERHLSERLRLAHGP